MASTSSWVAAMRRLIPVGNRFLPSAFRPQPPTTRTSTNTSTARLFHSTPAVRARKTGKGGGQEAALKKKLGLDRPGRKSAAVAEDPKLALFRKVVTVVRKVPPPLIMGRNRHLRHWTIHRAWQLLLHRQRDAKQRMLMRQWHSMRNACEELRQTAGPGTREEGYLYRVAMEKKGVYSHQGFPIEYARPQVETPAREAWNHGWKRI